MVVEAEAEGGAFRSNIVSAATTVVGLALPKFLNFSTESHGTKERDKKDKLKLKNELNGDVQRNKKWRNS